jgi:hypothetical protein
VVPLLRLLHRGSCRVELAVQNNTESQIKWMTMKWMNTNEKRKVCCYVAVQQIGGIKVSGVWRKQCFAGNFLALRGTWMTPYLVT